MKKYEFKVDSDSSRERLDIFLSIQQTEISRSRLKKLIVEGRVTVNGVEQRFELGTVTGNRRVRVVVTVRVKALHAEVGAHTDPRLHGRHGHPRRQE